MKERSEEILRECECFSGMLASRGVCDDVRERLAENRRERHSGRVTEEETLRQAQFYQRADALTTMHFCFDKEQKW